LLHLNNRLQYLLAITNLDSVFETFDSEPAAVSSFAPRTEGLSFVGALKQTTERFWPNQPKGTIIRLIASMRLSWSNNRLRTPESIVILSPTKIRNEAPP